MIRLSLVGFGRFTNLTGTDERRSFSSVRMNVGDVLRHRLICRLRTKGRPAANMPARTGWQDGKTASITSKGWGEGGEDWQSRRPCSVMLENRNAIIRILFSGIERLQSSSTWQLPSDSASQSTFDKRSAEPAKKAICDYHESLIVMHFAGTDNHTYHRNRRYAWLNVFGSTRRRRRCRTAALAWRAA